MAKKVIKSERGLNNVTKLVYEKVTNAVSIYGGYNAKREVYINGKINQITIASDYHCFTKPVIDSVWEVINEYQNKYVDGSIYGLIGTSPYFTAKGDMLHEAVIYITIKRVEE